MGIHAAGREAAALLHAACESLGHRPTPIDGREMPSNVRPQVGIWDAAVLDDSVAAELRAAVDQRPDVPWLVILDFPRREDIELALACGAAAVAVRPFAIDDLAATIARLTTAAT